jgi:prevent-host-death family protein
MVQRIIGVTELQRRFRSVIDDVAKAGVPYILTRGSRATAALVPYEEYQRLQALHEKEIGFDLDRLLVRMRRLNAEKDAGEVQEDILRARKETRRRVR